MMGIVTLPQLKRRDYREWIAVTDFLNLYSPLCDKCGSLTRVQYVPTRRGREIVRSCSSANHQVVIAVREGFSG